MKTRTKMIFAAVIITTVMVGAALMQKPAAPLATRSEFVAAVKGRTQDEVRNALGQPRHVTDGFPGDEEYTYADPESDGTLVVVFTNNTAVSVRVGY